MLKPGVLQRRITGEVISRFEKKGFNIIAAKLLKISKNLAEIHYAEHKGKNFYKYLIEYITSTPVLAMIVEREDAVKTLRKLTGPTNPFEASPGTIRGDYGVTTPKNILHASDSLNSAKREIDLFFKEDEIYTWEDGNIKWR